MAEMTEVKEEDKHFYVTFRLSNRWEVWRLSVIMTAAADWQSCTRKEGARWRRAGKELKAWAQREGNTVEGVTGLPRRPPSEYTSEVDMDHVLYGHAPYPLLSVKDMHMVYPLLEARRMSARHIAERLRVHHRSVVRWRSEYKKRGPRP